MKDGGWLDKYEEGGQVDKYKTLPEVIVKSKKKVKDLSDVNKFGVQAPNIPSYAQGRESTIIPQPTIPTIPSESVRSIEPFEPKDTRHIFNDSRAKERGDELWNVAKKATAIGQFSPEPISRYSSIGLNSLMGAADAYFSLKDNDLTNAKINAIGAIPLPGFGSIKALKNVPGLNAKQKSSILKTAIGALGVDFFGATADLSNNFGLEKQKNGGWLDSYEQGGLVLKQKTKDNYGKKPNLNDVQASMPPGFVGEGVFNGPQWKSPAWGGQFAMGGSLPGSVGFTYARTIDPAPSNGKYAKKTLASAQNGVSAYYQHGLDFKTKGMKNGGWLDAYDVPQAQDGESFFKAPDVPEYAKGRDVLTPQKVIDTKKYEDDRSQEIVDQIRNKKSTLKQGHKETDKEAEYRIRKNEQFQQSHPYSNIDEQGTLSRSQSDRTMEGLPEAHSRAYYNDQALDKAMTSLDAAGYITGAGELLGAAAPIMKEAVKDAGNSLKNLKQEFIYNAIDPVGYGAKAKILKSPKTFLENTIFRPENRAFKIGEELHPTWYTDRGLNNLIGTDPYYIEKIEEINRLGKNRLDAWRTGLGLEQKYNTFTKTPEGVFRINSMSPEPKEFAALHNDIVAHNYNTDGSGVYSGENPLVTLQKNYQDIASPKIQTDYGEFSINDLLGTRKGEVTPWKQVRKVKKESIYSNDASVFDNDYKRGVMGGYRWDVKKLPDGNLHFQSNDTWDLHPWQERGNPNLFEDELNKKLQNLHTIPKLKNIETLKLLGGKPYNIQNNFIVDPKTYKTIKSYKEGGVVKDDMGYWNPDNHGKVVEIDSNNITMEGVDQPLIGISDEGDQQYMLPGKNYKFKGKKVREYPVAKNGLRQEQKGLQNLDQLTNFTNYNKPQPGGWLDKY
jgi:hypothetical protein